MDLDGLGGELGGREALGALCLIGQVRGARAPGQRREAALGKRDPVFKMCQDLKGQSCNARWRLPVLLSPPDSVAASRVQDLSDMVEILI